MYAASNATGHFIDEYMYVHAYIVFKCHIGICVCLHMYSTCNMYGHTCVYMCMFYGALYISIVIIYAYITCLTIALKGQTVNTHFLATFFVLRFILSFK